MDASIFDEIQDYLSGQTGLLSISMRYNISLEQVNMLVLHYIRIKTNKDAELLS